MKEKKSGNHGSGKAEETAENEKILFDKPGNFLYPVPAVMVSCAGTEGQKNILTVAWAGTVCSDPPMVSISIRPERFSYDLIRSSGEFVINLAGKKLARAVDFCGCRSGRDLDKFEACHLTAVSCEHVAAPRIAEAPVSIECRVTGVMPLGSHDLFLAEVLGVYVDRKLMDRNGTCHLDHADLIAYSHGQYHELGKALGKFGYSVQKSNPAKKLILNKRRPQKQRKRK